VPLGPLAALRVGCSWVLRSPKIIAWVWLLNLAIAIPLAVMVSEAMHGSVSTTRAAEKLEHGFDDAWFAEHGGDHDGLVGTLRPTLIGIGAFLGNLDDWWAGRIFTRDPAIVITGIIYALGWAMALGGALAHFSRGAGAVTVRRFASDAGRTFFRFVRLAAMTAPLYYGVAKLATWLFPLLEKATRDVTVEGHVLLVYLAGAAVVIVLLSVINVASDFAKIAIVSESLASSAAALGKGVLFVVHNPLRVAGVYLVLSLASVLWLGVIALLPTGVSASSWPAVIAMIALGQVAITGRLALRLCFYASETALYRSAVSRVSP
jgi:hypothetical protein